AYISSRLFMTDYINKEDRQLAASLVRKYFNGEISICNLFDNFPNFENDYKIRALFYRIENKPKTGWLFGVSKSKYKKFLDETYNIIEELESDQLRSKTMKSLFEMLWLQSNNCTEQIQNMGNLIFEVSKMTNNSKKEVVRYLNLLMEKSYIENISTEPLLYQFTLKGKNIKTDSEIEELIKNAT
uniref:hypothetical protein n=1 Tax=Flavobacterium sp. UGB4466 TaxID=2730889 RepID=UPI001ED97349